MYTSIDLFAGIGGIRKGFENAFGEDISTVFVSEWDEYAQKTYRANYDDDFEIAGDITQIDEKEIPRFDICLAGFPCQAFSMAGKRMGFDDDYKGMCRGTLFQDVVRICEYHQPKVIFCENVKGLTIHDKGRTFKVIKRAFEQIGYTVYDKVLNSKDFGVPQNRERIYIVAFRNNIDSTGFKFPEGENSDTKIKDIDENNIATTITIHDITKMADQLDHSMGSYMSYFQVLCILLAAVMIYLLTKLIIEKNETAISMTKILGYENKEIASLYLVSTSIVVVLADLISVVIGTLVMKVAWKMMLFSYSGWFAFKVKPLGYVKMFAFVLIGYLIVMVFDFKRIKKIPMDQALKNVE